MSDSAGDSTTLGFKVNVYRVQVDDTPELAIERQRARRRVMDEELSHMDGAVVTDWGDTCDEEPHELVTVLVDFVSSPAVQAAGASVLTWIGTKLAEKLVDEGVTAGFKALARRIFRIQKREKQVSDAWIEGPTGSPTVHLYPPEWGAGGKQVAAVYFTDGSSVTFNAPPNGWTGDPQLDPAPERLGQAGLAP
jgi:hypothetical protein